MGGCIDDELSRRSEDHIAERSVQGAKQRFCDPFFPDGESSRTATPSSTSEQQHSNRRIQKRAYSPCSRLDPPSGGHFSSRTPWGHRYSMYVTRLHPPFSARVFQQKRDELRYQVPSKNRNGTSQDHLCGAGGGMAENNRLFSANNRTSPLEDDAER